MKLIVGLGNPGPKYQYNRHNVGFMILDTFVSQISNYQLPISNEILNQKFKFRNKFQSKILKADNLLLAKPTTFMNQSGKAVGKMVVHYKIKMPNLWVIHDDLDIALGDYKIQKGKGPKVHKGVMSIDKALGTRDYWHVRVGVENRKDLEGEPSFTKAMEGKEYVLQDYSEVKELIKETKSL